MKPKDFEQTLREQAWREIPPGWRQEMLRKARQAAAPRRAVAPENSLWTVLLGWLWPSPRAWAGLAAVWMMIALVNLATPQPELYSQTASQTPVSAELAQLRQQRQLMVELLNSGAAGPVSPKSGKNPAPRSENDQSNGIG